MNEDLITPNEVPQLTGGVIVTGKDFLRRERRGDFPVGVAVHVGGRIYVSRSRLIAFLEAGGGRPGAYAKQREQSAAMGR